VKLKNKTMLDHISSTSKLTSFIKVITLLFLCLWQI